MLGVAVIVFREVLEAALIIGVLAAASRGIAGRAWALGGGIAGGLVGALLVAAFAESLSQLALGMGQELFNAGVLGLAVLMLAWHSIWMSQHGAALAAGARRVTDDVRHGARGLLAVALVAAVAVLREGAETVLFLYGMAAGNGLSAASVAAGGALGLAAGAAVGLALYGGLLRIPVRHFFTVTGALVLLVAAGLAGHMARLLIQADVLSALRDPMWDTSWLLETKSALGSLLQALVGYDPRPSETQLIFYLATLVLIVVGTRLARPARVKA